MVITVDPLSKPPNPDINRVEAGKSELGEFGGANRPPDGRQIDEHTGRVETWLHIEQHRSDIVGAALTLALALEGKLVAVDEFHRPVDLFGGQ